MTDDDTRPDDALTETLDALDALDAWYAEHAPTVRALLRPGVPEADLDETARALGVALPPAVRALYRRFDGQDPGDAFLGMLLEPLGTVVRTHAMLAAVMADAPELTDLLPLVSRPEGAIALRYVDPGWLPLLSDGGGNFVGVDLSPGPTGTVGQVITFGRDETERYVLADSLDAFLREVLDRLRSGRVSVHRLDGYDEEVWCVDLLDADGRASNGEYLGLADLFPGFGAAPARRAR